MCDRFPRKSDVQTSYICCGHQISSGNLLHNIVPSTEELCCLNIDHTYNNKSCIETNLAVVRLNYTIVHENVMRELIFSS